MKTPPDPRDVLDDPDAPASEEELREAEALRAALDDGTTAHRGAEYLRSLKLAHDPTPIGAIEHRAMVEGALRARPKSNLVRIAFRGGGALALAAGIALAATRFLAAQGESSEAMPAPAVAMAPLAAARSTQSLFPEPFARGEKSARIDRIAMARAADLRDNRFARWGVR
jgi:hypothetical protein